MRRKYPNTNLPCWRVSSISECNNFSKKSYRGLPFSPIQHSVHMYFYSRPCLLFAFRTKPSQHINPRKQVEWHQTLDFPPLITPTSPVKYRSCLSVRGHICVLTNATPKKDLHILLSFQHLKNNILFSPPRK